MENSHYIAGDWGTSNLRLFLCKHTSGEVSELLDTRKGKGVKAIDDDFESVFFSLTKDWFDEYGTMPVMLSGMVGSNIGWKDAPYLHCPVGAVEVAKGRYDFSARGINFSILAGLTTINPLGVSDVMRGEELQLLGWSKQFSNVNSPRLFALPGTHNKWSLLRNGKIETFLSAFTGELFSILHKHSILVPTNSDYGASGFNQEAFHAGVLMANRLGDADLVHALFSTRSRQVLGEMQADQSASYLSGMIITADIKGAYATFTKYAKDDLGVTIIGEPELGQHYLYVCEHLGIEVECIAPTTIALAGFSAVYENFYG